MISGPLTILRKRGPRALAVAALHSMRGRLHQLRGRDLIKRNVHSYEMLLDLSDPGISRSLLLFGTRELEHRTILEKVLRPGVRIFDIGANIGYYPLLELSLVGGHASLICIEPSPSNVTLLRKNLELNGYTDIEILHAAVSDQSARRQFHLSHSSNLGTFHDVGSVVPHLSGESVEVETVTVGQLAERFGPPDLIRMDVEGHEVEILRSVLAAIDVHRIAPMILFETHLSRYSRDHDIESPLRDLFNIGYSVGYAASSSERGTSIARSHGLEPIGVVHTDDDVRAIFRDPNPEAVMDLVSHTGGLRAVLLTPPGHSHA